LLEALGAAVRNKVEHTSTTLIGKEAVGYWQRVDGLSSASSILRTIRAADAKPAATQPSGAQAAKYFPNLELLTQDGDRVRFYEDVLKDRTVLINFRFTTCTAVCLPMTANLARVQKQLGDRLGRDIAMISITVDPEADTPPALKAFSEKFGAKRGWYFLTGKKENVDWVPYKLGGYMEDKRTHVVDDYRQRCSRRMAQGLGIG
jgi:protein SCO1